MKNKTIKLIYKLKKENNSIRKIKYILNEKYKIYVTEPYVRKISSMIVNIKKTDSYEYRLLLKLYQKHYNTEKVIEYVKNKHGIIISKKNLVALASRNGVKKENLNRYSRSFISRKEEMEIIEHYKNGKSTIEIAEMYGFKSKKSILDKLNKHNIERRKSYEILQNSKSYKDFSLKNIDSPEKAYIIGLLITDGYVIENRNYFGIDLTDEDAIKFIADYINIKYTIIPPKGKAVLNKYRIVVYGENYIEQLIRYGITGNKTFTTNGCKLDKNEKKYLPYIIRGVIDGDGWIRKDGNEFFISSASEAFIYWCKDVLVSLGFCNIKVKFIKNNQKGIYLIRSSLKENLELLKKEIYDKPFGMGRKYYRLHKGDIQRL